jgi:hypothetical protein
VDTGFGTESAGKKVTWKTSRERDSKSGVMAGFGISGVETFGSNVQTVNQFVESL